MRILAAMIWAWVGLPIGGPPATRQQQIEVLNRALRSFDEAARIGVRDPSAAHAGYEAARRDFESLVAAGVHNGRLLYNLGNTYMRLGQVGRAIVCYRRAERLIPGDANLAENLRFARSIRADQISATATSAAMESLLFWHYRTPLLLRARLALGLSVACWGLLTAGLFVRSRPAALVWTTRLSAVVAVALAVSVFVQIRLWQTSAEGVIVADNVVLRKGNGESYEPQFNYRFSQGVEFVLIEPPREDWLHVRLPDGKDGWIRGDQAELL